MKKAIILHVGAGKAPEFLGTWGPIFPDGKFAYVPIPEVDIEEAYAVKVIRPLIGKLRPTYKELNLQDLAPWCIQADKLNWPAHYDPEFETYSYGDWHESPHIRYYEELQKSDYLFFMASLKYYEKIYERPRPEWIESEAYYIIGYFLIERIDRFCRLTLNEILQLYWNNAHIRHIISYLYDGISINKLMDENKELILFKGDDERSALLDVAVPFSKGKRTIRGKTIWWPNELACKILQFKTDDDIIEREERDGRWWAGIVEEEGLKHLWKAVEERNPGQADKANFKL